MILDEKFPSCIVALEGVDGAGKTTCRHNVVKLLKSAGLNVEGAGEFESPIGEWLSNSIGSLSFSEKILLFAADRASGLAGIGNSDAQILIWDRYVLSAFAYRVAELERLGRVDEEHEVINYISAVNAIFPVPALTIWLRLPIDVALERKEGGLEYLSAVERSYEKVLSEYTGLWATVDASQSAEDVAEIVAALVKSHLGV
jgi:thymidylate kinase